MKTRDIFSLAVLALTMAACTSDETTQSQPNASASAEVIPFSAVIKNEAATTRGLEEGYDGKSITATWRLFEQVAVVHSKKVDVLSITDVDIKKGTATVEGGISGPVDGETVQVVYLGSSGSVMADFKTGLLSMGTDITKTDITFQASKPLATRQKGTLDFIDQELDYRYTDATLKVSGGNATFETAPSLIPQFAIWKVKLKGPATDLEVSKLVLKKDDAACVTIDLGTSTKSEFYMAVAPGNGTYAIQASADNYNYNTDNITATLEAGKFYTATIAMQAPTPDPIAVTSVELNKSDLELTIGETETLIATVAPENADDKSIGWTSDKESVATVDDNGKVTAVGAGEATITVTTTDGGKIATCKVTVNKKAGEIVFATAAPSQTWSATAADNTYKQTATNTGDATVSYSINDNSCGATINSSTGEVTFTKAGSVKVTASVDNTDLYAYATNAVSYTLTVNKAAGSISYVNPMVEKMVSDAAFTNELTKVGDGTVTYTSDNEAVAKVDRSTGEVTIIGVGEATIKATVTDGINYTYATKTATYTIKVMKPDPNGGLADYDRKDGTEW